ncbi:hypothetical protein LUZ61_003488 [Rhynchospora tenuis]|uniref:BHLH domain-containing protein n=1 Tax=Rhynchospora tenuis TaxID=198213 RepID=A0AAD5ZKZ8_9POAL|nr:hypothetical protein LUZ61_003488 [Rhynchospora tenuis]
MNQCVPSWDLDDPNPAPPRPVFDTRSHPNLSPGPVVPMPDFEVAELTWENGNISSHGLGAPRIIKAMPKYPAITTSASVPTSATGITWAKQQLTGGGTLEEVVNEATRSHMLPPIPVPGTNFMLWTNPVHAASAAVDMLVPRARDEVETAPMMRKRARVVGEDGRVCASQGSAAPGRGESTLVRLDTCGGAGAGDDLGFTTTNNSTSLSPVDGEGGGSPETENASIGDGGGGGANDSICQSLRSKRDVVCDEEENLTPKLEIGRASISTKRSRAAAIHNESERKRRDRINQKMKTLQKLVPNSSKTDKASMLDEVIDYLKQLQAQVNMMSRMMMPMTPMPQLQMSMMANMAQMAQMAQMGMSVGPPMMNLGSMGQPAGYSAMPSPPLLHPSTFVPFPATAWDGSSDRLKQAGGSTMTDPFSAFLACQAAQQSVSMDAYNRIAALYQQLYQQNQPTNSKP